MFAKVRKGAGADVVRLEEAAAGVGDGVAAAAEEVEKEAEDDAAESEDFNGEDVA